MKKTIILTLLLNTLFMSLLKAETTPYIGAGIATVVSDIDNIGGCRLSTSLIGGAVLRAEYFDIGIEGRVITNFRHEFSSSEIYIKPQYEGVYGLLGYGRLSHDGHEYFGYNYGIGYDFGIKYNHFFIDVIYGEATQTTTLTTGFIYRFKGL